ncbi:3-phosphoglycerate dehydrogenase [Paracoccus denitrificans]|uniref:NAD(P)-dependent oxidoreductase n=1 Tax=Paracoccus denitrificans TaxID=266 RepID=UPI001E416867|nr:NAD(P)-dependent oxidoreductase [Paracoccus denitrificans]UFS67456.1 3-phosphoglycerate dehydrogenase [Paracoccus denitrificans]
MKCLIVQPIHESGLALLRENGIEPVPCPAPDMATVARHIAGCQAVITRDAGLSAPAFAAAGELRVVVVHGTGHDPVDKGAATARGVVIANTPGANAQSVAELALGLALAVARRIPAADRAQRAGVAGFRESARFAELSGKTALIVGWGAIGRSFGRMLDRALGMTVLVHSPRASDTAPYRRAANLAEGLAQADLVSLHTPLRAETRGMMGLAQFRAMKPGAILLNLARAGLVDEPALCEALASGRLAGAGLDVWSGDAPQGPLAAFPNVVFTPHLGGTTEDALKRVAEAAARHVISALSGRLPETAINPEVWSQTA